MPNLDSAAMHIAEFLCFAQHVQYLKSEQRVFLSDFQGMSSDLKYVYSCDSIDKSRLIFIGGSALLTDCQVITTAYVFTSDVYT